MRTRGKVIILGIFDIILSLAFIGSNLLIWDRLSRGITSNDWGPLQINIVQKTISGGHAVTLGLYLPIPNYPFILFWVAIIGNFLFVLLAFRGKVLEPQK